MKNRNQKIDNKDDDDEREKKEDALEEELSLRFAKFTVLFDNPMFYARLFGLDVDFKHAVLSVEPDK